MNVYWVLFCENVRVAFGPALFLVGICILVFAFSLHLSSAWYWCGGLASALGFFRLALSPNASDEVHNGGDSFDGSSDGCD